MIPPTQVCSVCKREKINTEFEILSRTKIAKRCLECDSKAPEKLTPYQIKKQTEREVSRETAKRKRKCDKCRQMRDKEDFERFKGSVCEQCVTSTPYVQLESKSIFIREQAKLRHDKERDELKFYSGYRERLGTVGKGKEPLPVAVSVSNVKLTDNYTSIQDESNPEKAFRRQRGKWWE